MRTPCSISRICCCEALDLLRRMDDFAQSRYRLESRYHHVLVDEFQDTSRAQWELVSLLIQSWGEGAGLAHSGPLQPSIFIVGDRKQSIYGFRDADVSVLREAARHLEGLRPDGDVRRTISRSFRAVRAAPGVHQRRVPRHRQGVRPRRCVRVRGDRSLPGRCRRPSRRPMRRSGVVRRRHARGVRGDHGRGNCAAPVVGYDGARSRDRRRPVRSVRAISGSCFGRVRATASSKRRSSDADIRSYVYKGLGFFDADEIKDVLALVWYLADPVSDLRAAAVMRSRLFGISDEALRLLCARICRSALRTVTPPSAMAQLDQFDMRALVEAREATSRWLGLVDRMPAAELIDLDPRRIGLRVTSSAVRGFSRRGRTSRKSGR